MNGCWPTPVQEQLLLACFAAQPAASRAVDSLSSSLSAGSLEPAVSGLLPLLYRRWPSLESELILEGRKVYLSLWHQNHERMQNLAALVTEFKKLRDRVSGFERRGVDAALLQRPGCSRHARFRSPRARAEPGSGHHAAPGDGVLGGGRLPAAGHPATDAGRPRLAIFGKWPKLRSALAPRDSVLFAGFDAHVLGDRGNGAAWRNHGCGAFSDRSAVPRLRAWTSMGLESVHTMDCRCADRPARSDRLGPHFSPGHDILHADAPGECTGLLATSFRSAGSTSPRGTSRRGGAPLGAA